MGLLTLDERYYCGEEEFKVNGTVRFLLSICLTLPYFSIDVSVPKILLYVFYTSIHTYKHIQPSSNNMLTHIYTNS